MVGIIPAEVELSEKPEGHGYVIAEIIEENPFFPVGLSIRGHEFHHSRLPSPGDLRFAYRVKRGQGIRHQQDGIVYKNLFASYIHLHALGTPEWAEGFVSLASKKRRPNRRVDPSMDHARLN
jgi:cobyrinic acid a,c-diamide synthase